MYTQELYKVNYQYSVEELISVKRQKKEKKRKKKKKKTPLLNASHIDVTDRFYFLEIDKMVLSTFFYQQKIDKKR